MERFDLIISGGGMVGMTLAVAVGRAGLRVAVVDRAAFETTLAPEFDGRASALAYAPVRLLQAIGVWPHLAADATPIDEIRVSDRQSLLHVHFDCAALGQSDRPTPLGMMVENRYIRSGLGKAVEAEANVTVFAPDVIVATEQTDAGVTATLKSGQHIKAPLLVVAEGRKSALRDRAGIRVYDWDYDQLGMVCTVRHEKSHENIAHERFLKGGPFAILPLSDNRSSIVWTERTDRARAILALGPQGFESELRKVFGDFLGEVTVEGPRWSYPLSIHVVDRFTAERLALIGDSAHGIHPIAGQGLNLGLKDVAALAEVLVDTARLGLDIGSAPVLDRYVAWRRFDTMTLSAVTDVLNRLFQVEAAPVRIARQLGLGLVNQIPPLKQMFMEHARGNMGSLPRLLMGEAL